MPNGIGEVAGAVDGAGVGSAGASDEAPATGAEGRTG
jgi:hypothetical protein